MTNLFNRRPDPEQKLMAEIENTEFKKQSIIAPLQNEVQEAQYRIDDLLYRVGSDVYKSHIEGSLGAIDLKEHFDAIAQQEEFIKQKEAKIAEFVDRFDEEIRMLSANLKQMMPPAPQRQRQRLAPAGRVSGDGAAKAFCEECGQQYIVGQDTFCGECGYKLS